MTALPLPGLVPVPSEANVEKPFDRRRLEFFVPGEPKPMGSKTAFVVKGKFGPRAVVTDGKKGPEMRAWKDSVIAATMAEDDRGERIMGAVRVSLTFFLARPAGHTGKKGLLPSAPRYPAVKPDLDKLARSTLDALAVALLSDDARVVTLELAKRYAEGATGARIVVEELG